MNRRLGGTPRKSGCFEREKNIWPLRGTEPRFLVRPTPTCTHYIDKTACKLVKDRVIYQCKFRLWCRKICCYTGVPHARTDVQLHKDARTRTHKRTHAHTHTHLILFVRTVFCGGQKRPLTVRRNIISLQVSANSRNLGGLED